MRNDCARCGQEFDPHDKAFDGSARYKDTKFCRRCIDRCHESTEFDHACRVCQDDNWTDTRPETARHPGSDRCEHGTQFLNECEQCPNGCPAIGDARTPAGEGGN